MTTQPLSQGSLAQRQVLADLGRWSDVLAADTPDFSGADLKALVEDAVSALLQDVLQSQAERPLCRADLQAPAAASKPARSNGWPWPKTTWNTPTKAATTPRLPITWRKVPTWARASGALGFCEHGEELT